MEGCETLNLKMLVRPQLGQPLTFYIVESSNGRTTDFESVGYTPLGLGSSPSSTTLNSGKWLVMFGTEAHYRFDSLIPD